ncbi:MAG: NAD(P)H-hydrate dehydratase [Mycobacteriales bacterium]
MTGVWTVGEVRAAEEALMARLPEGLLMRRAATGLARRCAGMLGRVYGARVALLVGAGNNGGDTLYAGAGLAGRGARVDALLLAPDRAHAGGLAAFRAAGGRVHPVAADDDAAAALISAADLVVDGVVGIGGSGGLRPPAAGLAGVAAEYRVPTVAVDVPSGVDADTGAVAGAAVRADVTVTFGCLKPGLVVMPGAEHAGLVEVVDIGLLPYLPEASTRQLTAADVAALLPLPGPRDDKYTRGVVGVAAGSDRYPGAALLCVGGARHGAAGMVRYAGGAADRVVAAYPDVVVTGGSPARAGRVQAWAVGSGLGGGPEAEQAVAEVLAADVPVVLDADGITIAAGHRDWLDRSAPTVVTPHDREFARLAGEVGDDRLAAARRAAADLDVVVLLKGATTVVAAPDGTAYVNPLGTDWLATAGSGDVLTGIIGSLLAGGVEPPLAAAAAAFLHELTGVLASDGGPLAAADLVTALPAAVRRVLT